MHSYIESRKKSKSIEKKTIPNSERKRYKKKIPFYFSDIKIHTLVREVVTKNILILTETVTQ